MKINSSNLNSCRLLGAALAASLICGALPSAAQDWPAYMHDNARSGVTTNALRLPLAPLWTYSAPAAPKPAWPDPQTGYSELPKMKFDDALYVVAAEGRVFFGSSVDNQVHALDAATGKSLWSFFTDAPVRLAPAYANQRVYAASDDGFVYCLQAADGRLLWKFSGAPKPEFIVGNGRVTSLWPVRTGVLVDKGVVYFASGIFKWQGISLYALTADEGKILWSQEGKAGYDGERTPLYNWSPQGYLLATDKILIVPAGRAMPTFWNRSDGTWVFPASAPTWIKGEAAGVYGVVVSNHVYVGTQGTLFGFGLAPGAKSENFGSVKRLVARHDVYYLLSGSHSIRALSRAAEGWSKPLWTYSRPGLASLIIAGSQVISGGSNEVVALDAATGKELWVGAVKGRAAGLAVAAGRLLVSTDQGTIHCFGQGLPESKVMPEKASAPARNASHSDAGGPASAGLSRAVKDILNATGWSQGYAVVTGPSADALACEIARQSELNVYVYEPDLPAVATPQALQAGQARARTARQRVDASGLYGSRVTVSSGVSNALPYPDYMANLIICAGNFGAVPAEEWLRVLRPCGGVLLAGGWGAQSALNLNEPDRKAWVAAGTLSYNVRLAGGLWTALARGPLEGSGWWTHRYADAGNSGSSGDRRVAGQMQVLWCGEPGANKSTPDRSYISFRVPLVLNGRVFHLGFDFPSRKDLLLSFDAYNGTPYWERELPTALSLNKFSSRASNPACATNGVFVAVGSACHRFDLKTGETLSVYETPKTPDGKAPLWGQVAVADGRLFGSTRQDTNLSSRSSVFACDIPTGRRLWVYSGREILDSTLTYGEGRLFFLVQPQTGETNMAALPPKPKEPASGKKVVEAARSNTVDQLGQELPREYATPMMRTLVALDAQTGREVFVKSLDVKGMGSYVQMLFADGKLIVCGLFGPYGRAQADEPFRRAMALSARDGALLWNEAVGNIARPLVMGDWLLAPPQAYDLKTGARAPVNMGRYAGCGQVSASASSVFFRSGHSWYLDLVHGSGGIFDGIKPGCFINIIPAGGVVVEVEASSGCTCDYALQGTFAFKPVQSFPAPAASGK